MDCNRTTICVKIALKYLGIAFGLIILVNLSLSKLTQEELCGPNIRMIRVSLDIEYFNVVNGMIYYQNALIGNKACLLRDDLYRGIIIAHNFEGVDRYMKGITERNQKKVKKWDELGV